MFTISAEIALTGDNAPAHISMALPSPQTGMKIISEESESGEFGYTITKTAEGDRAEWAKRTVEGDANIFYKITVVPEPFYKVLTDESIIVPQEPNQIVEPTQEGVLSLWEESDRSATLTLIDTVRKRSADPFSFTAELIGQFNAKQPVESVSTLLNMKGQNKLSHYDFIGPGKYSA